MDVPLTVVPMFPIVLGIYIHCHVEFHRTLNMCDFWYIHTYTFTYLQYHASSTTLFGDFPCHFRRLVVPIGMTSRTVHIYTTRDRDSDFQKGLSATSELEMIT